MATEEFVDATIATLKVIGMLGKNGKLCVRNGQLCLDVAEAQSIRRWVFGDSRDGTLMHVRNTITCGFKITQFLMDTPVSYMTIWTLDRLAAEMAHCERGLQNLKTTYVKDSLMVAHLEVLIDRMAAHLSEVSKYLARTRGSFTSTDNETATNITDTDLDTQSHPQLDEAGHVITTIMLPMT